MITYNYNPYTTQFKETSHYVIKIKCDIGKGDSSSGSLDKR